LLIAAAAYVLATQLLHNLWLQLLVAIMIYTLGCLLLKQVRTADVRTLKLFLKK